MKMSAGTKGKIAVLFALAGFIALYGGLSWAGDATGEARGLFARGNEAYAEGKYDDAISCYKRVMEQEGYSASLLYNLANAYYMKKDAGQAVLNYERALYLDPGDKEIRQNLELAQRTFRLGPESTSGWQGLFNLLNLNRWAVLASLAFVVFSLLYLLRNVNPGVFTRAPFRIISACSILCLLAGGTGVVVQYENTTDGVVIRNDSQLRISPFDSASACSSLPDGKVVSIDRAYRDYLLVNGDDGKSGWIKKNAVAPLVPPEQRT
ncbi:MAG: tetratricopeptide repeat protein [Deltaproteobacteria bacterium]|nr:tetratricopeptide repeat protein [Deltaproteobacteria bacterium]MBW2353219.1 tetratricopeptide repeat protein [Deltaproteobacteria bacterium]HDZ91684.1 tetratricopeptide repeat protein [Deltaproteobacteria bacterium]